MVFVTDEEEDDGVDEAEGEEVDVLCLGVEPVAERGYEVVDPANERVNVLHLGLDGYYC